MCDSACRIPPDWCAQLRTFLQGDTFRTLWQFVTDAYKTQTVYPAQAKIFTALALTPFEKVKVVILGQDPYHEPNQAQGLAFWVPPTLKTPPSLRNIAKECALEYPTRHTGKHAIPDLQAWARQGVLLLNAILTVRAGEALSHRKHGWEAFTDAIVQRLNDARENLVFLLWGADAQRKGALVDRTRHLVLEAAHPSPLSAHRGFFGCNHFRQANDYLEAHGQTPICW